MIHSISFLITVHQWDLGAADHDRPLDANTERLQASIKREGNVPLSSEDLRQDPTDDPSRWLKVEVISSEDSEDEEDDSEEEHDNIRFL